MSKLSSGWVTARIDEANGVGGISTDGDWLESKDQDPNGEVRLVQLQDVGDGFFINKSARFLTKEKAEELKCTFLKPGDVLIARMPDPLGRACIFPDIGQEAVTAVDVHVWRCGEYSADANYFKYCVNSPEIRASLQSQAAGTTRQRVAGGKVKAQEIPLPPLAEQKRIVRKLNILSARTTTARIHLTAIAKLVERHKLAVLGHLFGKSSSEPKPTEHLWAIPTSWKWKKVKDIGEVGLGRQRSPENHQGPDMRPYIRSANITWSGVDTTDVKEMNFDDADFQRFELKVGDVLLNEGSGSAKEVGKPAIWRGEIPNCCFQNTVLRVQPHDCSSAYLYWYFLLTARSEGFVKDTKGVNIQHIGKGGLANFPIPVPPPDEQDEIVRRIETALTEIDRIAAEAEKALKLTDRLDERILAKAFVGELVSQDPNDEPASVLLDRIREARANAPKKPRPRRTKATAMKQDPKEVLLADSAKWSVKGVTPEELTKRTGLPHDGLRDALFELLGGTKPQLEQVFDKTEERMRLRRVAQ